MQVARGLRSVRRVVQNPWFGAALLGAAFFLLAEASAPFVFAPYQNAVVWLPGGLALGVMARTDRERWPHYLLAIFVAEVISVDVHHDPLWIAALWAVANCARAAVGAELMRRYVGPPMHFDRMRDVAGLVAFGGVVAPVLSASIGTATVAFFYGSQDVWRDWLFWFLSDATGTVLVAPLVLTWRIPSRRPGTIRILEWCALPVVAVVVGNLLFGGEPSGIWASLAFISFPLLIYAALRTGPAGAAFASVILGGIAVWRTVQGRGPFGDPDVEPYSRVLAVETFLALMSLSALALSAAVLERRQLERRERLLSQCGSMLAQSLDVRRTLPHVLRRIVPRVARAAAIWLIPPEGGLALVAKEGMSEALLHRLERQAAHLPSDVPSWVDPLSHVLLIPLTGRDELLGVFAVLSRTPERAPGISERTLFEELAGRCALAIENAHLFEESQRAIQMREEFIAIAAHELRTPLTALKLQLDAALHRSGGATPGRFAETIARQVARLTRLVENLLDMSRLAQGRIALNRERTNLSDLVRDVVERLSGEASRRGSELVLHVEEGVVGAWDPLRVEQIITNLLANALKFGGESPVEVAVQQRDGAARVTVTDHGPGIPPHALRRIFDRFEQAVSAREFGGLGLGLYLAKQMTEAHGGRIWVTSEVGKGASFTVELPAAPREAASQPPAPLSPTSPQR